MINKQIIEFLTENHLNIHRIVKHIYLSKHPDKVILQKDILKALLFLRKKNILTEKNLPANAVALAGGRRGVGPHPNTSHSRIPQRMNPNNT